MAQKKGYEILAFRDKHGELYKLDCGGCYTNRFNGCLVNYPIDIMLDYTDDFLEIYSVRRLSDNMVFKLSNYPLFGGEISRIEFEQETNCILVFLQGTIRPMIIEK